MKIIKDLSYKAQEECTLDMYLPEKENFPTIVYFHGGSLETGDKNGAVGFAEQFVKKGIAIVSVNYRMYTNGVKFPAFLSDAASAVAFVKREMEKYGGNGEIYVSGSSAGAWLTLMLCMDEKYLKDEGIDPLSIAGWISDSAQTTSHFSVLKYELGEDARAERINEYAPQYFVSERTRFSKMLLMFYESDIPCRYEQNMLFYKSVLRFNESANVTYAVLSGGHCQGVRQDEKGEYAYVKTVLKWLAVTE